MVHWQRPENVPFPSVWRTFERNGADGVVRKYWVQDVTPEYEETMLGIAKLFLDSEPLCKSSKFLEDPKSVEEFTELWRAGIKMKLAVICLTRDDDGKIEVAGCNLTTVSEKDEDSSVEGKGEKFQKVLSAVMYATKKKDVFSTFNVNEYLTAYGLYVFPKFRGQGLGTEILKARRELCLAVGLKLTATIFTSIYSQKNAKQAGFEEFSEIDYDDLEKVNPDWNFPGITLATKSIKHMYIKFE